ncbi:MAG: DMT family transporter [Clostridia bacterium]|nr:DMT family transporter [Clostridia bacterium]
MKQSKEWIRLPAAAAAIAVFCTLLWGTAFPCIKIGYELFRIDSGDVPSKFVFAGWRFFGAGILVMVIGLIRRPSVMKLHRRDIIPIGVLGLFQTFLQYLLLYSGLVYVSGTKSSIFTSVSAFGSVVLSAICFRSDRLTVRKIGGCLIGVAGILIMNAGGDGWDSFTLTGDGFVILSNLCGAVGNVISKKIAGGRDALQISAWQLIFGGGALTVIGYLCGGTLPLDNSSGVWLLIYLAVMAGTAFLLWTLLLFYHPVSRIAVFLLLIPVSGTLWSGLFLGENIFTLTNMLSLLCVCSGIFLVNSKRE